MGHEAGMRRLLMITYWFLPFDGVVVQRSAKHCKYLPEMGWRTEVLVSRDGQGVDLVDKELLRDLRPDQVVHQTALIDPIGAVRRILGAFKKWRRAHPSSSSLSPSRVQSAPEVPQYIL